MVYTRALQDPRRFLLGAVLLIGTFETGWTLVLNDILMCLTRAFFKAPFDLIMLF